MTILETAPRSATVMTVEPCQFLLLEEKDLIGLLNTQLIVVKILKHCRENSPTFFLQHLRKTNEQIYSLVMFDINGEVRHCLLN